MIGGRDLVKGKTLAAQFDHRGAAVHVDVLDACSLDSFCKACSIIVNHGGPVMALQVRVAQSAFRTRCHYADKDRDYWINGLIVATVARMISEGRGVQSGLHSLADAVDPLAFTGLNSDAKRRPSRAMLSGAMSSPS